VFGRGENDFLILRRLVKQGGEIHFQRKIILPHLKKIIFSWKSRENNFSGLIFVTQFCLSFYFLLIVLRITQFSLSFSLSFFPSSSCSSSSSMISIVNICNYFLSSLTLLQLPFWRTSQSETPIVSSFAIFFNLGLISLKVNWIILENSEKIEIH